MKRLMFSNPYASIPILLLCVYGINTLIVTSFVQSSLRISMEQVALDQKILESGPDAKRASSWIMQTQFDPVPADSRQGKLRRAQAFAKLGQIDAAYALWNESLLLSEKDPICPSAILHVGIAFAEKWEIEKARSVFENLLKTAPRDTYCVHGVYAQWLLKWDIDHDYAAKLMEKVVRNTPLKMADRLQYVICLDAAGRTQDAIFEAKEALRFKKENWDTLETTRLEKLLIALQEEQALAVIQ